MFTGIVEATGTVEAVERAGANINFTLSCPFTQELKIDQSLAHDGCCLTVVELGADYYKVTAIDETLQKTNLGQWRAGTVVNMERCMRADGRLDGHIVQGHVDATGKLRSVENRDGSFLLTVDYDAEFVTVPQGSICMNGISLTVAESGEKSLAVAIIPYTWEFTNVKNLQPGDRVNMEFDIIGKYIARLLKQGYAGK